MIVELVKTSETEVESKLNESKYEQFHESASANEPSDYEGSSTISPFKGINIIKSGFNSQDEYSFKILLEFLKKKTEIITSRKEAIVKKRSGRNLENLIRKVLRVEDHMKYLNDSDFIANFTHYTETNSLLEQVEGVKSPISDAVNPVKSKISTLGRTLTGLGRGLFSKEELRGFELRLNPMTEGVMRDPKIINFMVAAILQNKGTRDEIVQFVNSE